MKVFNASSFLDVGFPIKCDRSAKITHKNGSLLIGVHSKTFKLNLSEKLDFGKIEIKGDEKIYSIKFSPFIDQDTIYNLELENNGVPIIKSDLTKKIHYKDGVFSISGKYSPFEQSFGFSYANSRPNFNYKIFYDKEIHADLSINYPYFVYNGNISIYNGSHNAYFLYKNFRLGGKYANGSEDGVYAGFIHNNCQLVVRAWPKPKLIAEVKFQKGAAHVEVSGKDDISAACQLSVHSKVNLFTQVSSKNWKAPIVGFSFNKLKSFVQYSDRFNYSFEINL